MAATLSFIGQGGSNFTINNLNNSGLGFFGAGGFGNSVSVGFYQDTTYITDGNGINQGPQVTNVKWIHPNSGRLPGDVDVALQSIPNYQATFNVHFTNDTPVKTQNAKIYIYDRTSTSNPASGVTTAVSNIVHPAVTQVTGGSGLNTWEFPSASSYLNASVLSNGATFSPGRSGLSPNGANTTDTIHDWYFAISASPNSIGSKPFYGILMSVEFL